MFPVEINTERNEGDEENKNLVKTPEPEEAWYNFQVKNSYT